MCALSQNDCFRKSSHPNRAVLQARCLQINHSVDAGAACRQQTPELHKSAPVGLKSQVSPLEVTDANDSLSVSPTNLLVSSSFVLAKSAQTCSQISESSDKRSRRALTEGRARRGRSPWRWCLLRRWGCLSNSQKVPSWFSSLCSVITCAGSLHYSVPIFQHSQCRHFPIVSR